MVKFAAIAGVVAPIMYFVFLSEKEALPFGQMRDHA